MINERHEDHRDWHLAAVMGKRQWNCGIFSAVQCSAATRLIESTEFALKISLFGFHSTDFKI